MRDLTVAALIFLVGCSGGTGAANEDSAGGPPDDTISLPANPGGSGSGGPCDNAVTTTIITVDGGTYAVTVPTPCQPWTGDRGDPPPDENFKWEVDPWPGDTVVVPQIRGGQGQRE